MTLFENLFLSVGAMKAGTTWLYAMLSRHPELHFTPEKEIHYFYHRHVNPGLLTDARRLAEARSRYLARIDAERDDIAAVRRQLRWVSAWLDGPVDDSWYRGLFLMSEAERWACDFSNLAAHLPQEAWPRIAGICRNLRVLYTMRDPVRRLWSHTKFHLQFTGQLDCLDRWGPEDYRRFLGRRHVWENAEYGAVLRRLKAGLPEESLLVMFHEEIHADERRALARVEDFLGVARFDYPEALIRRRFTESARHPMPDFFPGLVAEDVARICREVEAEGYRLPQEWRRASEAPPAEMPRAAAGG